jgi:hypothetical protein
MWLGRAAVAGAADATGAGDAAGVADAAGAAAVVSATEEADSEVAQLPVPLAVATSPTAGLAADGEKTVEADVWILREPHPGPACISNSDEFTMPRIGPETVTVPAVLEGAAVLDGAGVLDAVISTEEADSEVAQLPAPVAAANSPTAGFAPDGETVVDAVVWMFREPHPAPPCISNSDEFTMPRIVPDTVMVPFEFRTTLVGEDCPAGWRGRLGTELPLHEASARAQSTKDRDFFTYSAFGEAAATLK